MMPTALRPRRSCQREQRGDAASSAARASRLISLEGQAAVASYKVNGGQLFLPDVDRPGL